MLSRPGARAFARQHARSDAIVAGTGGRIYISVPNASSPFARSLKGRWFNADIPLHLMQFTPQSLEEASRRAGLTLLKRYTASWLPGLWGSLLLHLRTKFLIPRKLSSKFTGVERRLAPRLASWLDRRESGEEVTAILGCPDTKAGM